MGSRGGGSKTRVSDYYLAAHVGVCHGPVEAVLEVVVGEKLAWQGSSSPADGSQVDGHDVWVDNPGLFGGNKKEGGVRGVMTVMHGAPSQLVPSKISQFLGLARDKVPGYRGLLSLLFHSADGRDGFMWSSNNPYLKPLWVKVRARPGTWYPEKAMIDGDANPMHIIRECLVNTDWGMGAASKSLDDTQMRQIADVLYSERFGLSLMWAQQTEIEKFIGEILRHINGTMCVNPRTGKFHFKLIREDYTQGNLPSFNRDQGTIRTSQRKAWDETVNEINVSWTNPTSEETEVVTVHDPANITIQGAIVPDSRDMYGIRNIDLATRVAMREIQVASKPLLQVEVDFDRSAFGLLPGDAIKLVDWKELNFEEIVMRVVNIDYGTPDSMVIKVSLVEDVFGQPAVYTAEDPNRWQSTAEDPVPIVTWEVMTAPYFMIARLLGETRAQSMTYPAVYPVVLAAPEGRDTNTYVQQAQRGNIAGTGPVWQNSYDRVPVGHASLVDALPIGAAGSATLTGLKGRVYAETGNYLYVGGQNGEICLITDTSTGALTLRRGCLDTSPRAWPAGTPVWLLDDNRHGFDEELSAYGATQNYRLLPTTSKGQLPVAKAPVISGAMSDRPFRPYPPANARVNGELFPSAKQLPLSFTWSERNRILETSIVLPWDGSSVPAEPGTSYTLELDAFSGGQWRVNAVAVRNSVITSFDVSSEILPSNTTAIRFRLWAEKEGLRSWTTVEHTFAIGDSGAGLPPDAGVEFNPPPKPVSVKVTAYRNAIKLEPQFAAVDRFACEYWRSRVPLVEGEIEAKAFKVGQGVFVEDSGLLIDTVYFYFLRAVNPYGKSGWYAMEARTKIDPQEILDEMDGLIDSSKLTPELQEEIALLPLIPGIAETLEGFDPANITAIQAQAELSGQAALEGAIKDHEGDVSRRTAEAGIYRAQKVIADDQQALAQDLLRLDAKYDGEVGTLHAAVQEERTARATADEALARSVSTVQADLESEVGSLRATVQSESEARVTADTALGKRIDTTQASLNGVTASVQQNSSAIVDLENGAEAMWTVKAQAGDISAGIGLIADEATGKSQVLVNASQFFVFDNAVGKTAVFAIDQGQVIIREAVIKKATVSILNATEITATNIKANATISSPAILGGSFNGGSLNIADRFKVDGAGNVIIRHDIGGGGMTIENNRIQVRDTAGVVRVKIGWLG